MVWKKGAKPRRKVVRRPRRKIIKRSLGTAGDYAHVNVNLGLTQLGANQLVAFRNFSLSNSDRAKAVASGFQYYRIKKVTIAVKPIYDTFQLGGNSTVTLPYLYYMIDRHSTVPLNATAQTLKSMGAKPLRLDDKTRFISFKPSVVNASVITQGNTSTGATYGPGAYRTSPWLSTNANNNGGSGLNPGGAWAPDSTDHQGLVLLIEQYTVPTPNVVCQLEYMVEYEFKKRLWVPSTGDPVMYTLDLDTLTLQDPPPPPESK